MDDVGILQMYMEEDYIASPSSFFASRLGCRRIGRGSCEQRLDNESYAPASEENYCSTTERSIAYD